MYTCWAEVAVPNKKSLGKSDLLIYKLSFPGIPVQKILPNKKERKKKKSLTIPKQLAYVFTNITKRNFTSDYIKRCDQDIEDECHTC